MQVIADRFEVGDFIAQGGMGAVYRGLDRQTGQTVAIKSVRPELVDAALIARFQQEGETLRTLNHPNIVKLVATVQDSDQHYLIMEYVNGGSLADLLAKQSSLAADQTVSIALELADALTRAHHLKIIHRDLKPANVLLAEDGTPRLTDFGVARTAQGNLTGTGVIVGTLSYLAPEILNGEPADARADIWAFGVMLFELLTGRLPFRADSPAALITAILTQPTPDLESLRPELPVALVDLVYRMLDKDPRQRIGSMRMIAAELEALYKNGPDTERLGQPVVSRSSDDSSIIALPVQAPIRDNLPAQTTPFVGREAELTELAKMIADPGTRLITILGPGGMGKTRLSLECAAVHTSHFPDGVYFVELAPISDPESIISATADAVGFQFYQGEMAPRQQMLNFFREKSMLVIFDNFEHILATKIFLANILATARNVKLLVTSRERLNLQSETLFRIEGMDFPDWEMPEDAAEYSAVKLFLQSAKRVAPAFELSVDTLKYLSRICRLVQGMPLGILLAAAWVDQLTLAEIAAEIARSIDFLETEHGDVPERQRSVRAAFDYSWNLLSTDEQQVFMNASVFRGGFTREAAQAVTNASLKTLAALVNKSLIRRDPTGRYDVHELLRQYAEAKLSEISEGLETAQDRHCDYYASFMKRMESQLKGPKQLDAFRAIEVDFSNVLVGWYYAVDTLNLVALHKSWQSMFLLGYYKLDFREQNTAFQRATNALETDNPVALRGILLGCFHSLSGDSSLDDDDPATASFELLRRLNAQRELAFLLLFCNPRNRGQSAQEDLESLRLFERLQEPWGMFHAHLNLGLSERFLLYIDEANKHFGYAAQLLQTIQTPYENAELKRIQGWEYLKSGELQKAQTAFEEATLIFNAFNSLMRTNCLIGLSKIATWQQNYARALDYSQEIIQITRASGQPFAVGDSLANCGLVYFEQGQFIDAKRYYQESLAYWEISANPARIARGLIFLGFAIAMLEEYHDSLNCFRKALRLVIKDELDDSIRYQMLIGLAYLTGKSIDLIRGIELFSFAQSLEHKYDFDISWPFPSNIDKYFVQFRQLLTLDEFAAAVERGKALDLDTVVAELLNETDPDLLGK